MIFTFPLTPAILFLVGTVVLAFLQNNTIRNWRISQKQSSQWGLGITAAVFLVLAVRIAFRWTDGFSAPPMVIAPWGTGDGLTVRLDGMSTAFLFVPVLLLLASFWGRQISSHAVLMVLAGAAAVVFVAANGIGFSYALLLFDLLGAVFWFSWGWRALAVARLLLSVFTTGTLILAALLPHDAWGGNLFSLALWLRLTLFPFVETNVWAKTKFVDAVPMVWTALSTATGVYAAARFLQSPVPIYVDVLVGATVLFNALLAWLGESPRENTHIKLLRMTITQPGLILLVAPVSASVAIALGLGYTLALGALWLMPQVGAPNFKERHWLWVYTAPLLATLTIVGFPFTFGWVSHLRLFTELIQLNRLGILALVLLAEGLGFSVLYQYWRSLFSGRNKQETALWTALMVTVPFLLPGVAGVTFNVITGLPFQGLDSPMVTIVLVNLVLIWAMAFGFGYGREKILRALSLSPETLEVVLLLDWLWVSVARAMNWTAYRGLRLKAIFEGSHYFGWAILLTLMGILVVILQ